MEQKLKNDPLRLTLFSTITFLVLLTLLHIIKPEIEPTWRFISEYALGNQGWIMSIAFFAWASAFLFLFLSLRKHLKGITGKIGLICLLTSAVGLLLAGIFTTDPITAETRTTSGALHNLGGTLGLAMPISALFTCLAIWKKPNWVHVRRYILWATILCLAGFLVSAGSLGYMFGQPNAKPGPEMWVGIPTRFELLTTCAWLITITAKSSKVLNGETKTFGLTDAFNNISLEK